MADWVRIGGGQYKNTKTGQVLKGQSIDPNKNPKYNGTAAAPGAAAPAAAAGSMYGATTPVAPGNTPSAAYTQAQQALQQQVASGAINQSQMNFELERLRNAEQTTAPAFDPGIKLDTPADVINSGFAAGKAGQTAGNVLTNPNQYNPFGSQTTEIDPVTGQPKVTQSLSQPNTAVLGGLQGGAVQAGDVFRNLLGGGVLGSAYNPGEGQPMSNLENAVYKRLTHGMDDRRTEDREQFEQMAANRGWVGAPIYDKQKKLLEDRYDQQDQTARGQAVELGTQTGLQAMPILRSAEQQGFYAPSFQGFQSVDYQQPSVEGVFNTLTGKSVAEQQIAAEKEMQQKQIDAQKALAGGGGGGGAPKPKAVASPFGSGPPGS